MTQGKPVPNATVVIKGTATGTSTKEDGHFAITVTPAQKELVISSVGYTPQTVVIGKSNTINVTLASISTEISTVVVTGYTQAKKSQFSGAASVVSAKQIETVPVASFDQILQGRAPGLLVNSGSGQPGSSARVAIRGVQSISGAFVQPLYIVDGVPMEANAFQAINSNDFESVTVLKDASASAIYGSRAGNGVIVVTTKKGKAGATNFTYRNQFGVTQTPKWNNFDMMNTDEILSYEERLKLTAPGWNYSRNNPVYAALPATSPANDPYFQSLLTDLNDAKPLVPDNLSDIGRANKLAITGLQARVALYMRDWPNAETYSTDYINAIPLSDRASFNGIWQDANSVEVAFKLKRTVNINPGRLGSFYRGISTTATNLGTVTWAPSWKIWNSYDQTNDVRFASYLKSETLLTSAGRQPRIIQKYVGTGYATPSENVADCKIFRTGEMYLIRAEARAEQNKFTGANSAETDINNLRTARINGYTNVSFASKDAAITAVIDERFKELAFEGHRLWDLKRRNLPVQRDLIDAPSATTTTLSAGNIRFVMPIPFFEMQANRSMKQNDGY